MEEVDAVALEEISALEEAPSFEKSLPLEVSSASEEGPWSAEAEDGPATTTADSP